MNDMKSSIHHHKLYPVLVGIAGLILIGTGCFFSADKSDLFYTVSTHPAQEPHPWRGENLLNNPDHFQFVIVADRTGGSRPGIFEQVVEKVNLLQPEFVMSVGDQIDGYTQDLNLIETQWQGFFDLIAKLQMPYFFVPGNHDISNDLMLLEWHKRFGPPYYHFIYKNVLFLVLNTEDPAPAAISPDQTTYILNTLNKYKRVYWTLVFMHEPLWHYGDIEGYIPIAEVLKDRPHTIFSGHYHHYLYSTIDGSDNFILATSGGVSDLRGHSFGEFDHFAWVTMTSQGPQIANLDIKGILPANIVNDSTFTMVQTLRNGNWVQIEPAVNSTTELSEISTTIHFTNPANYPLQVRAQLPTDTERRYTPSQINLILPAGSSQEVPLSLSLSKPKLINNMDPLFLDFNAAYLYKQDSSLSSPQKREFILDWQHICPKALTIGDIDGKIDDWDSSLFIDCRHPQQIMEDWDWQGAQDGWFKFATVHDQNNIYIALEFFDDRTLVYPGDATAKQDKIDFEFDPDPESHILQHTNTAVTDNQVLNIHLSASPEISKPVINITEVRAALAITPDKNIIAELAVPLQLLFKEKKTTWSSFRLNIGITDHDNPHSTKPSILWWRPKWGSSGDYPHSGTFNIK